MTEKFTGIVLRTLKYNDNLMIADIFTESRGRVSFLVPVSRNKSNKVRSVLFQPLSILTFQSSHKQGKMSRLSDAHPYILYSSIPYDPYKSAIALYLSEFLTRALHEESDNASIFKFLEYSLQWLDEAPQGYADFHIMLLMRLTQFLGIAPNLENGGRGHCFDLAAGCFSSTLPLHGNYLTAEDAAEFFSLLACKYGESTALNINRKKRKDFLEITERYYRLHIPDFPQLKSAEVLKELFD